MRKLGGVLFSMALVFGASAWAQPQSDHSLSSAEYVAHGVPSPAQPWSAQDYTAAGTAFAALSPDQLPRAASAQSGEMMRRMTDPAVLEICSDQSRPLQTRLQQCSALLIGETQILRVYLAAFEHDMSYADDTLDLLTFTMRGTADLSEMMTAYMPTLDVNDPSYASRLAGADRAKRGLAQMMSGAVVCMGQRDVYSDAARLRLAQVVTAIYPRILTNLPAASQTELAASLRALATTDPNADIRAALAAFAT